MIRRALRLGVYCYGALLIVAMYSGLLSKANPGSMTWGPGTDLAAAAIAISHVEHGLPGGLGYRMILSALAQHLTTSGNEVAVHDEGTRALVKSPDNVEKAFQTAAKVSKVLLIEAPIETGAYVTTWAEDIGYADFYEIAFRVFGYHALSTHRMFHTILLLSFLIFAAAHRKDDIATAAVGVAVTAIFITSTADIFSDAAPNAAANRFLGILTVLPCLHLLLTGLGRRPLNGSRMCFLSVQALLYGVTITFRTSAMWNAIGAVAILMIFALIIAFRSPGGLRPPARAWQAGALAGIIAIAGFGYSYLREAGLNPVYLDDAMPHHLRWHSAMAALPVHPDWPKRKPLPNLPDTISDGVPFMIFENYMRTSMPGSPLTSPKVNNFYRARLHDSIMRMKLFEFVHSNPRYMIELYSFYKPRLALATLQEALASIPVQAWLTLVPMLILAATLLVPYSPLCLVGLLGCTAVMWAASFLPAIWAYSAHYLVAENLCLTIILLALFAITVLATALASVLPALCGAGARHSD